MFKVVIKKEDSYETFVAVPSSWESNGTLFWPATSKKHIVEILQKTAKSKPEANWIKHKCSLKVDGVETFTDAQELAKFYTEENDDNDDDPLSFPGAFSSNISTDDVENLKKNIQQVDDKLNRVLVNQKNIFKLLRNLQVSNNGAYNHVETTDKLNFDFEKSEQITNDNENDQSQSSSSKKRLNSNTDDISTTIVKKRKPSISSIDFDEESFQDQWNTTIHNESISDKDKELSPYFPDMAYIACGEYENWSINQFVRDEHFEYPGIPYDTKDEIDTFNFNLANSKHYLEQMIIRMAVYVHDNYKVFVKTILLNIFSVELFAEYTWTGKSYDRKISRYPFSNLRGIINLTLYTVVICTKMDPKKVFMQIKEVVKRSNQYFHREFKRVVAK